DAHPFVPLDRRRALPRRHQRCPAARGRPARRLPRRACAALAIRGTPMIQLPFLDPAQPERFPPVDHALDEPDGLLAAGGDLTPRRLLAAYRRGIFPWYSDDQPILWWSPGERAVFDTGLP